MIHQQHQLNQHHASTALRCWGLLLVLVLVLLPLLLPVAFQ